MVFVIWGRNSERCLGRGGGGNPTVGRGNQTAGGELIFRVGNISPLNELFAFRGVCSKVDVLIA